tara:strand:- start:707 stop:1084 length:378 start_codon:yes stop_codon:yes gene_type:complete
MFQRKRRFRRRTNGRNNMPHNSSPSRIRNNSFSNNQPRNNFRQSLSAEKAFEKYTSLAKEAMSSGDKTLSENYFQHADHFMRIIEDKNKNRINNKTNEADKLKEDNKGLSENENSNSIDQVKDKV